jgi:1,4-alpha-glucan branching enzyme
MLYKMPGDDWQRFANLRLLYTFMYSYPGKKLLFMGSEFGQGSEWNCETSLDWYVLEYTGHQGIKKLVGDLNHLYKDSPALHAHDFDPHGFEWIDCNDREHSVLSYLRKDQNSFVIGVFNFTPVPRKKYRIGVPEAGSYEIVINSDSEYYSGSNYHNETVIQSEDMASSDRPHSIVLNLPPLSGLIIRKKH